MLNQKSSIRATITYTFRCFACDGARTNSGCNGCVGLFKERGVGRHYGSLLADTHTNLALGTHTDATVSVCLSGGTSSRTHFVHSPVVGQQKNVWNELMRYDRCGSTITKGPCCGYVGCPCETLTVVLELVCPVSLDTGQRPDTGT